MRADASQIEDAAETLRKTPMFQKLDKSILRLVAFTSSFLTFRAGECLFEQGDTGDDAFIILEGELSVMVESGADRIEVARLRRNEIVGEIAVLCDTRRTATVMAASDARLLRLEKGRLLRLMREFPEISEDVTRALAQRLERTTRALAEARAEIQAAAE